MAKSLLAELWKLHDPLGGPPTSRAEMERDRRATHQRRRLQHRLDRPKDGLGIRAKDKVRAIAAVGRERVPVVFPDLGLGNGHLNLVAERIHMLKVCGTVLKIDLHFLREPFALLRILRSE